MELIKFKLLYYKRHTIKKMKRKTVDWGKIPKLHNDNCLLINSLNIIEFNMYMGKV